MSLILNPSLAIQPFDAATDRPMVMCEVPAEKDSTLRYVLPAELLGLLKLFDGRKQTDEIVAVYNQTHATTYTPEKIENLIESFFLPKTLLVSAGVPQILPAHNPKHVPYLYARMRLIPTEIVYPVAKRFGWLFRTHILLAWLPIAIAVHLWFYFGLVSANQLNANSITGRQFLEVTILTIIGALIHETGHASALISSGCKRTEIGIGLYLYLPVLYTDVSEAWKLSRGRRAIVDVAGIYFQSIFQLLLISLFWATRAPSLLYSVFLIDMAMTRTMSPFLRMDGYWLVADLFGISNLRQQSLALLKYYFRRLLRLDTGSSMPLSNLSRTARAVLCIYTLLCTAFFVWLCTVMYRQAIYFLIPNYPNYWFAVWAAIQQRPLSLTHVAHALFELLWRSTVLFGLSFFLYRTLYKLWKLLWGKLRFNRMRALDAKV